MPPRLRDVKRKLEGLGLRVEVPATGSHWKVKGDGIRTVPIAAHNGLKTELSWATIRKLSKQLGIDPAIFEG